MERYKRRFVEKDFLPKIKSTVVLGDKRKQSSWHGKMKKGTKMIVLGYDTLDGEKVLSLAFADDYHKSDFDPEMDYNIVYLDEIKQVKNNDKTIY
jgi:hypothetical protein